jgi:hypothetical protein
MRGKVFDDVDGVQIIAYIMFRHGHGSHLNFFYYTDGVKPPSICSLLNGRR